MEEETAHYIVCECSAIMQIYQGQIVRETTSPILAVNLA